MTRRVNDRRDFQALPEDSRQESSSTLDLLCDLGSVENLEYRTTIPCERVHQGLASLLVAPIAHRLACRHIEASTIEGARGSGRGSGSGHRSKQASLTGAVRGRT